MLSDAKCKNAKPRDRQYKLTDRDGLSLLIKPNGSKLWRFRYKLNGKDKLMSLGAYPDVPLGVARDKVLEKRRELGVGLDPIQEKKARRLDTFAGLAEEFFLRGCPGGKGGELAETTIDQLRQRYIDYLEKPLGGKPTKQIARDDIARILDDLVRDGKIETAYRVLALAARILDLARGLTAHPCYRLANTLPARGTKHFAALTDPAEIGGLLRALAGYEGMPEVVAAVSIAPHVLLRSGELRHSRWEYIDFDRKEWTMPAERMKGKREHIIPMSRQVVAMLEDLAPFSRSKGWLFPGARGNDRPISDNTLNATLRRLGYTKEQHTTHGWRTAFTTNIKKQRKGNQRMFSLDASETQLAHFIKDRTMSSYDEFDPYQYITERRQMMQYWSDLLDRWRDDKRAEVRPIHA